MPDHVQRILHRAYREDKPYNDIVLYPEREMRLNRLGGPDEVTLVPLNKIEQTQPQKMKNLQKTEIKIPIRRNYSTATSVHTLEQD